MLPSRPTVLLFGSSGQVGSALRQRFGERAHVLAPTRHDADFSRPAALEGVVERARPSLVINASAYTAVDRAETEPDLASAVNAEAPECIARACKRVGASLVHFSTDYVFDGSKSTPYVETDATSPLGVYGRTKLAGDQAIAASGVAHLTFRTSWVYGAEGRNFVYAILSRARQTGQLRVVDDQRGSPTSAEAIADGVMDVLHRLGWRDDDPAIEIGESGGVYNMSAAGETTWCAFAREIVSRAGIAATVEPITTKEFGAPAPRPSYSVLDNTKLMRTFGVSLPDWSAQLSAVLPRMLAR